VRKMSKLNSNGKEGLHGKEKLLNMDLKKRIAKRVFHCMQQRIGH